MWKMGKGNKGELETHIKVLFFFLKYYCWNFLGGRSINIALSFNVALLKTVVRLIFCFTK